MRLGEKVHRLFARPEPVRCVGGCLNPEFHPDELAERDLLLVYRVGAWWHVMCWERDCEQHGDQPW